MASTAATSVDSLLNKSTKVKLSRSHSCCLEVSSNFAFFPAVFRILNHAADSLQSRSLWPHMLELICLFSWTDYLV